MKATTRNSLYRRVARVVDVLLNPGLPRGEDRANGFALLVFPFGTRGKSHYISNGASKEEMADLFREAARRLDERAALERPGGGLQ